MVEGLQVHNRDPFESLDLSQKERSTLLGDLLPDEVVEEDPKPPVSDESSVQEQPASSDQVQEDGSLRGNSPVEPESLDKQEEIDANKSLMQTKSHLGEEVSKKMSQQNNIW